MQKLKYSGDNEWRGLMGNTLESILDSTASVIYVKDIEGKYLFINRQYEKLFHVSRKFVINKTDHDLFSKNFADKFRKNDMEVQEKGGQIEFDEEVPLDDGVHFYTSAKFPLYSRDKRIYAVCGISTDITERKKIEAALHEANTITHTLLEDAPYCNKIIDLDSRLQYMSPAGVKMLKIDDITPFYNQKFPPDFYPEPAQALITAHLERAKNGESSTFECQVVDTEGTEAWFQTSFVPVRDDVGRVKNIIGTSVDITGRKQAERALRVADIRNRALLEGSPVCNKIIDLDLRLQYMSSAGQRILKIDDIDPFYGTKFPPDFYPEKAKTQLTEKLKLAKKGKGSTLECQAADIEGSELWFQTTLVPISDDNGQVEYIIATSVDITDRKKADKLLNYQASHDELTGLVNRREFERRVERLLSTIKQDQGEHALCFMDLDQFKIVNDTCGHVVGDEMLRQISVVLQKTVRHRDTLARLGGDEFGVLMEHCCLDDAHRVAMTLQKAIQDFIFPWEGQSFKVGVSMGLVPIKETTASLTELLKQADAACYVAKDKGRNRIHVYVTDDSDVAHRHGEMQWVTRINHALEEDRLYLYAQRIMPLDDNSKVHYELLIRMRDEYGEIIPPGAFLPASERYNLVSKLDRWVMDATFALLENHPLFLKDIGFCAINLSGQSLTEIGFQDFAFKKFEKTTVPPEKICFEITETSTITNMKAATAFIARMRKLGCYFALDDFGSGLSSFGYLKNLKVDYLKIDGMFVRSIVEDPIERAMVKSINEIGQVMGMKTIAEFVENDAIKFMLKEIGVNYVQGYGVAKPRLLINEILDASESTDSDSN